MLCFTPPARGSIFNIGSSLGPNPFRNRRSAFGFKMRVRAKVQSPMGEEMSENRTAGHHPDTTASQQVSYCSRCATPMVERIPPGDERVRNVCPKCNNIAYENPKLVVGCVPTSKDGERVLLARRAIPPVGKWTVPAGFLELGERAESGAAREVWEETGAKLEMQPLTVLAVYNILPANQVQLLYRATVLNEAEIAPGIESQEVSMFLWKDIPWDELAFATVTWALEYAYEHRHSEIISPQLRNK